MLLSDVRLVEWQEIASNYSTKKCSFYPSSSLRDSTTYGVWTHAIQAIRSSHSNTVFRSALDNFQSTESYWHALLSPLLTAHVYSLTEGLIRTIFFRWLHDSSVISLSSQSVEYIYSLISLRFIICIAGPQFESYQQSFHRSFYAELGRGLHVERGQ